MMLEKSTSIIELLKEYKDVEIQRYYFAGVTDPVSEVYLHGFSDVSELAYAACIYISSLLQ